MRGDLLYCGYLLKKQPQKKRNAKLVNLQFSTLTVGGFKVPNRVLIIIPAPLAALWAFEIGFDWVCFGFVFS
jgi:hypothetical protein